METGTATLPSPAPAGVAAPRRRTTLTERASLNAAAAMLDYSAKIVAGLVVTPILVSGLGRSLYGMWEMLGRLVGYMSATDGRPTQALRLVVANRQESGDDAAKRRYVAGALVVWLLFLPLVAVVGAVLIWVSPRMTRAAPPLYGTVRLTSALLMTAFLLGGVAAVPEAVLRGMNLGYRRMGWQALLNASGALLAAGAVRLGLGLAGVGGAQAVAMALTGICFWVLVKAYVPWFGVARPRRAEVRSLLGMSAWLALGDIVSKLLLASDAIILGMVVAPAAVTTYVLTGYAGRLVLGLHELTIGSAMPGLGGVIGRGEHARAAALRAEILALTWLFAMTVGCTMLLWNRSFVGLWVGPRNYAGTLVNLLIVLVIVQTSLLRTDAYVIDTALRPGRRVRIGAAAAVVTITLGITLTRAWGMPGLCLGLLLGRLVQSAGYPIMARACLGSGRSVVSGRWTVPRVLLVSIVMLGAAAWGGAHLLAHSWPAFAAAVALTVPLVLVAAFGVGLPRGLRRAVIGRLRSIPRRRRA